MGKSELKIFLLLFLDTQLPDINEIELVKSIRKVEGVKL